MRATILLGIPLCFALTSAPAICHAKDSAGGIRNHIQGIEIPPVANAPFMAKVVVTWDQPRQGGGTISRQYYTLVARDPQGRVHRETRSFVLADSGEEPPLRSITITDPVSDTLITCHQASMRCRAGTFRPPLDLSDESGGELQGSAGNVTRESLGKQTMDDLPVMGTRETATSAGGSQNGGTPALPHTDIWYSPDLHMALSVIRSNPQSGQVTLTVTDLVRGVPDPSWFAVPSGFQLRGAPAK